MSKQGVKLLIVYSDNNLMTATPRCLYYLTNFHPLAPHAVLVLPLEGDSTLYVSSSVEAARAARDSWVKDIKVMKEDPIDVIVSAAKKWNTSEVELVASENVWPWMRSEVEKKLGSKLHALQASVRKDVAGADVLSPALFDNMGRGEDELELARMLAQIADKQFLTILEIMRPGMTEYEVSAEIEYLGRMEGADDNFTLLSASKHNRAMHFPTDHRLQEGDIVDFEISPCRQGQTMQLCRTATIGKPSRLLEEKYAILARALKESLSVIKPGVLVSEVAKIQNKVLTEAGYGEYCKPPYMRTRGHGYGIGDNALGLTFTDTTHIPLKEGMNMVVHPNQYIPEVGYLACGDPIVITATGYERCTKTETKVYSTKVR
jgi:Xaa-Pro aminopeptidase